MKDSMPFEKNKKGENNGGGGSVIIPSTPLESLLKKRTGDIDDTERLQRALDYCYDNKIPLNLDGGVYIVRTLEVKPSVVINGNNAILKRPNLKVAPYNMSDDDIKWVHTMNIYGVSEKSSKPTIINGINFDGSCWDMWTEPSYIYEQAHLLACGADYDENDLTKRLKVNITNCSFMNGFGDGIHIDYGVDLNISNVRSYDCFRGGIVFTAGGVKCNIDNVVLEGNLLNDGFDFEVDWLQELGMNININNVQMISSELDIQVPENSTINVNNLTMTGEVKGYTTLACGVGSFMNFNNCTLQFNYTGTSESRLWVMGTAKFNQCKLISNDEDAYAIFHIWISGYDESAKKTNVTFRDCFFDSLHTQKPIAIYSTQIPSELVDYKLEVLNCTFTENCGSIVSTFGGNMDIIGNNVNCGSDSYYNIRVDTNYSYFDNKYFTININNNRFNQKTTGMLLGVDGYKNKVFFDNVYYDSDDYQSSYFKILPHNANGDSVRANIYYSRSTIISANNPPTCPVMIGDTAICLNGDTYKGRLNGTSIQWQLEGLTDGTGNPPVDGGNGLPPITPISFYGMDTSKGYLYYNKNGSKYLVIFTNQLPTDFKVYIESSKAQFNSAVAYTIYKHDPFIGNWINSGTFTDTLLTTFDTIYHSYPSYVYNNATTTTDVYSFASDPSVTVVDKPSVDLSKGYIKYRTPSNDWQVLVFNQDFGTNRIYQAIGSELHSTANLNYTLYNYNEVNNTWVQGVVSTNAPITNVNWNLIIYNSVDIYVDSSSEWIYASKSS